MNQFFLNQNSFKDVEYDYMVSLGHRCCVGQGLNYMRKSSFPFDWQITSIDALPILFRNELKDLYPNGPGIEWVHAVHYPPKYEGGPEGDINVEVTTATYNRRAQRLVDLLKENKRKLLFIRSKYTWYWYPNNSKLQRDMHPVNYDLQNLIELSNIFKNQYKNNNFHILYVYQDTRHWGPLNFVNDICSFNDFSLPKNDESVELAKKFVYIEQDGFKEHNITPVIVYPGKHRVEGNRYLTELFKNIKLSDTQDFKLPYGFDK